MADFRFFKMAALPHLGFVLRVFGPPRRAFVGHCAKFGWNCSNFDNMPVLMFCEFGSRSRPFPCFSRDRQNSSVIAILKTSAGSISFNSWLRC